MTSRCGRLAIVAALALAAVLPLGAQTQRETRGRQVYVSVLGPNDAPVKGLTAQDFIVREDGRAREVLDVAVAPPASHIGVLVDDSATSVSAIPHVRPALLDFMRYMLAMPTPPQIGLATYGERPTRRVEFTTNVASMQAAIGKLFPVTGSGAYLLEAIVEVTNDFRRRKAERPMILVFLTDASPEFSNATRREVTNALKATGAALWTIVLQRNTPDVMSREWQERATVVNDIAFESGGANKTIISDLGIQSAFTWAISLLTTQYRVSYARPETLIPPTELTVEVRKPGLKVLAPKWPGQ